MVPYLFYADPILRVELEHLPHEIHELRGHRCLVAELDLAAPYAFIHLLPLHILVHVSEREPPGHHQEQNDPCGPDVAWEVRRSLRLRALVIKHVVKWGVRLEQRVLVLKDVVVLDHQFQRLYLRFRTLQQHLFRTQILNYNIVLMVELQRVQNLQENKPNFNLGHRGGSLKQFVQISPEVEVRHYIECVLGLVNFVNLKRVRRAL